MKAVLICCALLLAAPVAAAKSLYWPSLTVHLEVDGDGALHVTERHEMVFDGDWNGGERTFQLRPWHDLRITSLSEIVPGSVERTELKRGDLDAVNEYKLMDGRVLRWRARLPTDPPFDHARKIYEIAYTLTGALVPEGDAYVLNHDLAFPNRSAEIERFDATIDLAPEWQAADVPHTMHREHLAPGQSAFVVARLRYVGNSAPAAVAKRQTTHSMTRIPATADIPALRYALAVIVLAFALASASNWLRRERARGRFEPHVPLDNIDEQWLTENVFQLKPELVGAAWDRKTAAPEVAALIARLTQEGKLAATVIRKGWRFFERDVLHLRLLCDRNLFESYERRLINRLFFDRRSDVDTDAIRAHYKSKGFNPASEIEVPIRKRLRSIFDTRRSLASWRPWLTAGLLVLGAASMVLSWTWFPEAAFPTVITVGALVLLLGIGAAYAYGYREHVHELAPRMARALVAPALVCIGLTYVLVAHPFQLLPLQMIGVSLLALAVLNSVFNRMHARETPNGLRLRRALGSARKYFERELAAEQPRLKDEWFPYLLAFGLGPTVDRWFKKFGGDERGHSGIGTTSAAGHTSGSSSAWTGGGGTFGGAGASGSWASAVAGVAASVSAPSSGGGSGGGGGSSGGGGGGGW